MLAIIATVLNLMVVAQQDEPSAAGVPEPVTYEWLESAIETSEQLADWSYDSFNYTEGQADSGEELDLKRIQEVYEGRQSALTGFRLQVENTAFNSSSASISDFFVEEIQEKLSEQLVAAERLADAEAAIFVNISTVPTDTSQLLSEYWQAVYAAEIAYRDVSISLFEAARSEAGCSMDYACVEVDLGIELARIYMTYTTLAAGNYSGRADDPIGNYDVNFIMIANSIEAHVATGQSSIERYNFETETAQVQFQENLNQYTAIARLLRHATVAESPQTPLQQYLYYLLPFIEELTRIHELTLSGGTYEPRPD